MHSFKLALTLSVTSLILASCAACPCNEHKMAMAPQGKFCQQAAVDGMTCEACAQTLVANLGKQKSVTGVQADAKTGQVRIYSDVENALSQKTAASVISKSGYTLKSLKSGCN